MYITSVNVHLEMGKVLIVMSPFHIKCGEIVVSVVGDLSPPLSTQVDIHVPSLLFLFTYYK